ncbi:MAG: sodium:solute symporter [Bacteroidota bacterium]
MNALDYIIIVVYILGFIYLGYRFKNQDSGKSYYLGDKSFGWFPLAMSTIATQLSAVSFISAPAFVGLKTGGGMKWLNYEFALPLAMVFLMVVLIPSFYNAGIVSVYSFLEKRFGRSTRILLSIVFQISRAFATGVMIYTVALILMSVMSIPMWQTIIIIGIVTLIYSYQGGMKAVVYGDMIQMIILFLGILICLFFGLHLLGGWDSFLAQMDTNRLEVVDFNSLGFSGDEFGFWPMVLGGFFLYASYYGTDQSQVQRLFSANSLKTVKQTLIVNGLIRYPVTLAYCIMGLVVGTFALSESSFLAEIPTDKPDRMIPVFIKNYLPSGIVGLLIVAIFSAAMSSLSSAINSLSAASVEDLLVRNKKVDDQTYLKYSKLTALFWGIVCLTLAFFVGDIAKTVIEAINKIGSVFYGPMLATFLAAVAIKQIHGKAINIGLITGVLVNVYMWLAVPSIFWFWWNAIGAVVTIIVALLASQLIKSDQQQEDIPSIDLKVDFSALKGSSVYLLLGYFVLIILVSLSIPALFN